MSLRRMCYCGPMSNAPSSLTRWVQPCIAGVKSNFRAGLVLQAFALVLLLAYGLSMETRAMLDQVGDLKLKHGYAYSSVSTAVFGGLIPFLVLLAAGKVRADQRAWVLLFYIGFWLWKGAEIDALYRAQARWFGEDTDAVTIITKTAVDQFIYNPLWAGPTQMMFFLWKDSGFSASGVREALERESFWLRLAVVLVSTWVVWIPAVAIIYCLPSALQIPLFSLVLCFWCLILSFVSRQSQPTDPVEPQAA